MTVSPMREDELIAQLHRIVAQTETSRVLVGIGDDAAVWQPSRSHRSVMTSDALVDGVHFTRQTMNSYDAGWRAMAANLSDLAAMGARPVLATIALGVPPDATVVQLHELYRGMADAASCDGLAVVGGDITRAPALTIAITAVGEVRPSRLLLRSGGRGGDALMVTGMLGASRAGLDVARGAVSLPRELENEALAAHRHPSARVREGRWLSASANVRAAIDCSDGLATDLHRLCAASGCGALVDRIPIAPSALAAANALGEDPIEYVLAGGEEYELIVAVRARAAEHLADRFRTRFGYDLARVGSLRKEPGVGLLREGRETAVGPTGWDHVASVIRPSE